MRILIVYATILAMFGSINSSANGASYSFDKMASGLKEPWAIGFLPGGGWLVTLRGGTLRHYRPNGDFNQVSGVPKVLARGQGGLLDVVVARDFKSSRIIFLSYSKKIKRSTGPSIGTVLASARLSKDGSRLENIQILFEMKTTANSNKHFGGRIVEAPDGSLFLTLGERGDRSAAQDVGSHNGTIIHVGRNGLIPSDNPVLGQDVESLPEIWSFGHRNPQGLAFDTRGRLWAVEHGARGGDEVNLIKRGANYGWPIIAYGRHYTGGKIGEGTHKEGMEQPAKYWDPSIAPSGMMIYSGKLWPEWRGDFFIGALKFNYISRLERTGTALCEVEKISGPETGRVRDIREAPDGSIWFLSVDNGAIYRMKP